MFIIDELCVKGYEHVDIPSCKDLFRALGPRAALRNRSTDDIDDFSNVVNEQSGLSKAASLGQAVNHMRYHKYLEEKESSKSE